MRIPAPLPEVPRPLIAVGKHGASSVDAEDFSRRLGNWGNASKLIGDRWEALAPALLARRLPWRISLGGGHAALVRSILAVDADPVIGTVLQRAGVSAPDLLLVGEMGDRTILRAADCKVSLDTADREQTAPARLQQMFTRAASDHPEVGGALLTQLGSLAESERPFATSAIEAALGGDWHHLLITEGLFVAPDNGFNRWFLDLLETRRRTGAPLGRLPASGPRRSGGDVKGPVDAAQAARLHLPSHLEPLAAHAFLEGVPGWQEATLVARLDGIDLGQVDLIVAERCWRVGVGLRGAVLALKRRLFHNALPADGSGLDVMAVLNQLVKRRQPRDSAELVSSAAQYVNARRQLWQRESELLRTPLSYPAWTRIVGEQARERQARQRAATVAPVPSARPTYRELTRRHAHRIAAEAARLEEDGMDEQGLLTALEAQAEAFNAASTEDATALAQELVEQA